MTHLVSFTAAVPCCVALLCSPGVLEHKGDKRARLFKEAEKAGRVALYIEKMPTSEEPDRESGKQKKQKTGWSVEKAKLRDAIPADCWRGNLRIVGFDEKGALRTEAEAPPDAMMELAFALQGPQECALYLSWIPKSDVAALVVSHRGVAPVAKEVGRYFRGKKILLLSLPRIGFRPFDGERPPSSAPDDGPTNLWGAFSSREWFFRTREVVFEISGKKLNTGDDGFSLAIDFGTSSSTMALVKHNPRPDEEGVRLFEGLASWRHAVVVPDYSRYRTDREIVWNIERWESDGSRIAGVYPAVPENVRRARWPLARTSGGIVPSLLYRLPDASPLDGEYIAGGEAEAALADAGNKPKDHEPVRLNRFIFSPKSGVSSQSADFAGEAEHVEAYLRALFDMAAARLAFSPNADEQPSGYLKKLNWSFPVTWLGAQKIFFRECLRRALEGSSLRWFLPGGKAEETLAGGIALDEASASFMGFLWRRFGNMNPKEILDLMGPFDYRERSAEGRNVLVIDFGEGTTDVVWLHLSSESEAKVVSRVKRHFALNQGGLEVTRKIAETLKEMARDYNVGRGKDRTLVNSWLRTNLKEAEIEERYLEGSSEKTVARFRREKATLYFDRCEEIKKALSSRDEVRIDWQALLAETPLEIPEESAFTASRLISIVESIFKPIFSRISMWAEEEGRLDVVLVSGRASALRGLREELERSVPPEKAPLKNDFIWPADYGFRKAETDVDQEAKTVVSTGLAHNVHRQIGFTRNFIECETVDELKRSRSIGILAADDANRWLPRFRNNFELLVRSDFSPINPGEELSVPVQETNYRSEGAGLYLGINFAGREEREGVPVDRPQPFARIALNNRSLKEYSRLAIFFRQFSATELALSRAEIEMPDGSVERTGEPPSEGKPLYRLTLCDVEIEMKPYFENDDMRNSGKIHLDAREPIDRDYL